MITVAEVKTHLNIDSTFTTDDTYITSLISVADAIVAKQLNVDNLSTFGEVLPAPIKQAELLLIGNLYQNREPVTTENIKDVPYTYSYLLSLYKNYEDTYGTT